MLQRLARLLPAALLAVAPLGAQESNVPEGWTWRPDSGTGEQAPAGSVLFDRMPPGYHMTTSTSGVVAHPGDHTVSGRYAVEVEGYWFPTQVDGEPAMPGDAGWGIILDDPAADPATPRRMAFLIRRDGMASVHLEEVGQIYPLAIWTADSAITAHDGENIIKYVLRVEHVNGRVSFKVNEQEVLNVSANGMPPAMKPGLRVGPSLNIHVSRFDLVTPLAPPRPYQPD